MNFRFLIWSGVMILSLVVTGLCIRILASVDIPLAESLVVRGGACLLLTIYFAQSKSLSLIPKSLKTQIFRAGLAGLALTFFSLSYNWLSASAVSVLSNADVPFLMVLGPLVGIAATLRTRITSALSILLLAWYVTGLEKNVDLLYGLSSLSLGSILLCFGYLYIKKSMNEENEAITVLTPSLAIIIYGLVEHFAAGGGASAMTWTPPMIFLGLLSGAGMFGAYYSTMRLYETTDLVSAEFPTLISSIVIQPIEMFFLHQPMRMTYILSSIAFVLVTYSILNHQNRSTEVAHV